MTCNRRIGPSVLSVAGAAMGALALIMPGGCSGNGSTPALDGGPPPADGGFTGLIGCDAGSPMVSTQCAMSIPLTGGVSGTFSTVAACGSSVASLSWNLGAASGLGVGITFMGAAAPVDQLGTFPLERLDITQLTDAGVLRWSAPPTACSVTIEGSICSPTMVFTHRRVLSGTGTCLEPAAPQVGTTAPAITIGDFSFVGFINPM
jgi:hypothetical protein